MFSIVIRFRFSTWYQSPRALTSNSILPLPYFKKKKSKKLLTTNLSFSENSSQIPVPPIKIGKTPVTRSQSKPARAPTCGLWLRKTLRSLHAPPLPSSRFAYSGTISRNWQHHQDRRRHIGLHRKFHHHLTSHTPARAKSLIGYPWPGFEIRTCSDPHRSQEWHQP